MDLLLPQSCAGCGAAGERMCKACLARWRQVPQRVFTTVDPQLPVWALGPYDGPHRAALLAMKEKGRRDVANFLGPVVSAAVDYLAARGELSWGATLVPAPTRVRSARLRGGDPVERVCIVSGLSTSACVRLSPMVADSVGLDAASRSKNLKVLLRRTPPSPALIIDDVVTTGATIAATAAVLRTAGVRVEGALAWCAA